MRRAIFQRLFLVLFGFSLVGIVEAGLRLFADIPATPATAWTLIDPFREEQGRLVLKETFLGTLRPASLAPRKAARVIRIFCFGGSTTYGYPWPPDDSWPAALERRLRALYPDRPVEIVNLGGTSYGSARILGLMRGVLKYEPDLFIAAFGHNEFVEDSYQAAVAVPAEGVGRLRALHLYRALELVLPKLKPSPRAIPVEPGDATAGWFFTPQLDGTIYAATPARHQLVLARFTENARAMSGLARDARVPLILATEPSSIINWPPGQDFAAPTDPGTRDAWERLRARAQELENRGEIDAALPLHQEAARLWDGNAGHAHHVGTLLLARGRTAEAIPWLERARDLDPVPVRAVSALQHSLRSAAAASGIPLVDGSRDFLLLVADPRKEQELILDHVHLTVLGNHVFSRQVWLTMRDLPAWKEYTDDLEAKLTGEEELDARKPRPFNSNLAYVWGQIYARKGLTARAEELFRQAAEMNGSRQEYARMALAQMLFRQGRRAEAGAILEALTLSVPDYMEPYPLLGRIRELEGDRRGAILAFRRSFYAGNTDRHLAAHLVAALVDEGRTDEAAAVLEQAAATHPHDPQLEALKGWLGKQRGSAEP